MQIKDSSTKTNKYLKIVLGTNNEDLMSWVPTLTISIWLLMVFIAVVISGIDGEPFIESILIKIVGGGFIGLLLALISLIASSDFAPDGWGIWRRIVYYNISIIILGFYLLSTISFTTIEVNKIVVKETSEPSCLVKVIMSTDHFVNVSCYEKSKKEDLLQELKNPDNHYDLKINTLLGEKWVDGFEKIDTTIEKNIIIIKKEN